MSSSRQLGVLSGRRERKSWAEANVSGCQPTQRISNSSDSRTEMSSSTTNTVGVARDMDTRDRGEVRSLKLMPILRCSTGMVDRSGRSKCDIERLTQSLLGERLEQALHSALCEHARTDDLIYISVDDDVRNVLPAT